jgi:hypothetical protein
VLLKPEVVETFDQRKVFPKHLTIMWWLVYPLLATFVARLLYEQTWLTYRYGEQMIGFAMIHSFPELLILGLLGWIGCIAWCIVALALIVRRSHQIQIASKLQLALAVITLLLLFVPIDKFVLKLCR